MKKTIVCFLLVLVQGFYLSSSYADEGLQVLMQDPQAKVTYQVIDENKLLISALDAEENPIRGLKAEDFVVMEGTKKAQILSIEPLETSKEVALNIVFVVDNSFSMKERKAVEPLLSAVDEFLKVVRPMDNVHVVVFDKKRSYSVRERSLHVRTFKSSDTSNLRNFIRDSFDRGLTTETFLYEAMVAGIDLIHKMPKKSNKFLVVFSDGEDLNSAFKSSVVESEAKGLANFEAFSVDYMPGPTLNPFLKSFAEAHGGRIWKATTATELLPIFKSFSTTLLHRYVIAYRILNPPQGTLTIEPAQLNFTMLTMTDGTPILNNVLFEAGKNQIPDEYVLFKERSQTQSFDENTLTTALERYYNVLNIVGKRLSQNPGIQIQITGCNSGVGLEENNLDLSQKRAETVKAYLNNVWGVDAARMKTGARNLPISASPSDVLGGRAENQRVEIEYLMAGMQETTAGDFIVESSNRDGIKIQPHIVAEYGIANWEVTLLGDDKAIKTLKGTGRLKPFYELSFQELGRENLTRFQNLQARIKVIDIYDDTHEAQTAPCPVTVSKNEVIHGLIGQPYGSMVIEPDTVTIEELTTIDSSPMLNYVFFDTGKSEISERYFVFASQGDTKTFSESNLKGAMEKYLHVLNIIGKRLVEFPEAQVSIVGCNADYGKEKGRTDLSRSRAEAVRAYLKYIWAIDSARMHVEVRNLPAVPATSRLNEGRVENQRVEIYSDLPTILEPIKSTYVEEMSDVKEFRIQPQIQAGYGIARWKIQLAGDGAPIGSVEGKGDLNPAYTFDLKGIGLRTVASNKSISANIEVIDNKGQTFTAPAEPVSSVRFIKREERVAQKMGYKVLEKYALILFDFDSSNIKEGNKDIVEQIIQRMKHFPTADVKVVGHTDNIGKEDYNLKLSERRAKAVYDQILAGGMKAGERITYAGAGPHDPLYDNSLPEGRALNRTVTVSLEYEKKDN
ncbi:MAG: OmpA family protein [Desulfobacteraceae bacterium]|nr:MAG: OmpA family protein [Desulfobacteraceae bacterium]